MEICLEFLNFIAEYLCALVDKSLVRPLISVLMQIIVKKNTFINSINYVLLQTYNNMGLKIYTHSDEKVFQCTTLE